VSGSSQFAGLQGDAIILSRSWADSVVTRLASCAVASLLADARRRSAKEAIR
jgi:hypothetical protein